MKIPLPNGRCFYIGKDMSRKSASIVRNERGQIVGTMPSYQLESVDRFLDCFSPATYLTNFVFLYENVAEVFFPIHYITSRIKNANFVVKRWKDDSVVWGDSGNPTDKVVGERMMKILSRPNCIQTFKEFVEQAFIYRYLTGDSYIYAASSSLPNIRKSLWKYCDQFWNLPSQNIEIDTGFNVPLFSNEKLDGIIKSYRLFSPYGNHEYDPSLVLHVRDNHNLEISEDYFVGRSRLLPLKYPICNICAVYEARNAIYVKRGAIGAVINMKKDADTYITLSPDEKKSIRQEFHDTYGVTGHKDPLAIIDVPVQYVQFGMSIQDLQPFEESLTDAAVIAGLYNIDSVLIPRKDNATFSNLREAECKVYSSTIIPDVKQFCEDFSEFIGLNAAGYYIEALWDDVEVLQDAKMKRESAIRSISDRCKNEFFAGLITLNEWRAALGKERIISDVYEKTILQMSEEEYLFIKDKIK